MTICFGLRLQLSGGFYVADYEEKKTAYGSEQNVGHCECSRRIARFYACIGENPLR